MMTSIRSLASKGFAVESNVDQKITCENYCKRLIWRCVLVGNISPIDVITHVPILCEDADIPYIYVASNEDLANSGATKRPTCCVLVLMKPTKGALGQEEQEKLKSEYDEFASEVKELGMTTF